MSSTKKYLIHIVYWVFTYFYILDYFYLEDALGTSLILSLIECLIYIEIFYFNYYVLSKLSDKKENYLKYTLILISFLLINLSAYHALQLDTYLMESKQLWRVNLTFSINFALNILISSLYWYYERFLLERQKTLQLKNENLTAEINLLKAQISPHFLFNSLNNIYSLSLAKSDNAPVLIEKLSDILRYLIYQGKDEKVKIENEITLINKYLDIQKLKKIRGAENIYFKTSGIKDSHVIVPLILINFIENAFKHGDIQQNANGYVNIELNIFNDFMKFNIENSNREEANLDGIGLQNVKKQLALNYENHDLKISKTANKFSIKLDLYVGS